MGLGHEIDGNTVALWRLNTITAAGLVGPAVDDSGGGWDLDQGLSANRSLIQGALGGVTLGQDSNGAEFVSDSDLCVWIPENGLTYLININPGTGFANNILASTWTFEAWIYIESFTHGSRQMAFRFANLTGGSGSANNEIQIWFDNSTGEMTFFWQHDSKVSEQVNSSLGSGVAVRTWTHIAVTCEINVLDWDVTLYIDGVEVGSGTAEAPALGEYSGADVVIGRDFNNANRFHGGIGSIALSDIARAPSAIATAAASGDSRVTPDGNHFALWNYQQEPQAYDHGPNGLHLVSAIDTSNLNEPGIFGILPDAGLGHHLPSNGQAYKAPKRSHFISTFQGAAEWTLEAWARLPPGASSTIDVGLLSYGADTGDTQPANFLIASYVDRGASNVPNVFWENGAGDNILDTGATSWWESTLVDETSLKHLALVKRSIGGSQSDVEYYRDGGLVDTMSALDDPDGGDAEDALFFVFGNEVSGGATPGARMFGFADDIRLSNVARSQPDIQASFEAGIAAGGDPPSAASVTVGCVLVSEIDNTALSLVLTVVDGITGPVTGLAPKVRIRKGDTTDQFLDFNDNTFKTSGWTRKQDPFVDLGRGQYQYLMDVDVLSLVAGDSLVAEYESASIVLFDASEIILIETAIRIGLTLTVTDNGGITGLTGTVRVRDAATTSSYLDWDDLTFKTSGWTTLEGPLVEIGDGHYHRSIDFDSVVGFFSGVFVAEYTATDGSTIYGSSDRFIGLAAIGVADDVPPTITVISPPEGTPVNPDTVITFEVKDDVQLALSPLYAEFPGIPVAEMVYNGTALLAPYVALSAVVSLPNGGKRFALRRTGGWPGDVNITFIPTDTSGNTV